MKTNLLKTIFLLVTLLLSILNINAQEESRVYLVDIRKDLLNAYRTLHNEAEVLPPMNYKTCNVDELLNKYDFSDEDFKMYGYPGFTSLLNYELQKRTVEEFDASNFKSLEDKALNAFSNASNFSEFVVGLTGKGIAEINEKYVSKTSDKKEYKDIDVLRDYYNTCKERFSNKKVMLNYFSKWGYGCNMRITLWFKVSKFSYPNINYIIEIEKEIRCSCEESDSDINIKDAKIMYEGALSGLYTKSGITIGQIKNLSAQVVALECCPTKEKEEPISSEPQTETIDEIMPYQYIGGGAGFGASQDFEEISYCVFAEYLTKISSGDENAWYIGLEGTYSNWSFNDSNSNRFKVGSKIQYHTGITENNDTQFVAGIMGSYVIGSNDNGFSNDDLSGIIACIYGGINIRVCNNWSLFGQFPILNYESITFKNDAGGEFKTDDTSLLLNKDNPVKLGVRFNF